MENKFQKNPFHLVTPSPWPLFASVAALLLTLGGVMYMHSLYIWWLRVIIWVYLSVRYCFFVVA